jgi:pimeloyl-ACP methyl ester carboxylesterase
LLRRAGLTEAEVSRFQVEIVDDGALPGALGWYRALPFSGRSTSAPVRVPTTHVWGDGDVALARRGAELTEEHVHAPYELRILPGVGHWVPTREPEALADAIIARVCPQRSAP